MNASSEVLQKFRNVDWLYSATRSNICFQSRCWVLFYSALLNGGALFGLVSTFSNTSEGALLDFNLTVWLRSQETQEHISLWNSSHTRPSGVVFRRETWWLCSGNHTTEFCRPFGSTNISWDPSFTSCDSHLFEPFLSRGRSCCFYTGIQKWVMRLL